MAFYCGTSNITLPVPNKASFPPEFRNASRLCYYASLFNTLEVNSSFYKIPMQRTVEKWASDVPDQFRFTFKLYRNITHAKELNYDQQDIQRFMNSVNGVGHKKGCILVQFPPGFRVSAFQQFRQLLDDIKDALGTANWNVAIEFRNKGWYQDKVYQLLEAYKWSVVVHDMPASATPLIDMDADVVYLRFHGEHGDYRGSYSQEFLHEYAAYIHDWIREGKTVFAYFNNTVGDAVHNAIALRNFFKR